MLRFVTAGESHGRALVSVIENFPAGCAISIDEINHQLARRQMGFGRGARMGIERDQVMVLSGLRHGRTLGSPIALLIENKDWPNWERVMDPVNPLPADLTPREIRLTQEKSAPRPGHGDLAGAVKYQTHNLRNVLERGSARETAARVAGGAVATQLLAFFGIQIASHVVSIGKVRSSKKAVRFDVIAAHADRSPVRCLDAKASGRMVAEIKKAAGEKDTLGGIFEVRATGLPIGLGSTAQWTTRLDGQLAAAMMSIPSVKGVEIGAGFAAAQKRGSAVHDRILFTERMRETRTKGFLRPTNRAGGLEGGMTNGAELILRAACKPLSTLMQPLETVDLSTKEKKRAMVERSDICVVPAAAVVGEAMVAMVLASAFTDKFGGDSLTEMEANFKAYEKREF